MSPPACFQASGSLRNAWVGEPGISKRTVACPMIPTHQDGHKVMELCLNYGQLLQLWWGPVGQGNLGLQSGPTAVLFTGTTTQPSLSTTQQTTSTTQWGLHPSNQAFQPSNWASQPPNGASQQLNQTFPSPGGANRPPNRSRHSPKWAFQPPNWAF